MVVRTKSKSKPAAELKTAGDRYSVKTICQLTGLNEHTLRAWERRYQVVTPSRLDNGRRVYTVEDLEKLKLVTLLIRKGFLIGNIAENSLAELNALVNNSSSILQDDVEQLLRSHEYIEYLKEAIACYDLTKLQSLLQQARVEYGIRPFLIDIILPFIRDIGEAVARGECSIGQEHGCSAIVKCELMQLLYLFSRTHTLTRRAESSMTFAIATNEGNQHEFGTLIAAVLCAFHGYPTYYFGPSLPAAALADAGQAVGANCILLGLPTFPTMIDEEIDAYTIDLQARMPSVSQLWVGGIVSERLQRDKSVRKLSSLHELERLLTTVKKV